MEKFFFILLFSSKHNVVKAQFEKKNSSEELFAGRQWVKNPKSGEMDNICH